MLRNDMRHYAVSSAAIKEVANISIQRYRR
jgi:hypothetical protein